MSRAVLIVAASIVLVAACGNTDDPGHAPAAGATLEITALAGPVCPVETDPPARDCAPIPVDMAGIVVYGPDGAELTRETTGPDGTVVLEVVAGEFMIEPQPVEGLLGTAAAVTISVVEGQRLSVTVDYDTGIR